MLNENRISGQIVAAAVEVHKYLGPGLLESAYELALCRELSLRGLKWRRQVELPVEYKGVKIDCAYRMDLLVEDTVVVEIKAVEDILPIHQAQLLTYLRLSGKKLGLILNFHVALMKDGIVRMVNDL